jgi:hypothetical protein
MYFDNPDIGANGGVSSYSFVDNGWRYDFLNPSFYCSSLNEDQAGFWLNNEYLVFYELKDHFSWFEFDNGRYILKQEVFQELDPDFDMDLLPEYSLLIRNGRIVEFVLGFSERWSENEVVNFRYVFAFEFGTAEEITLPQEFLDFIAESKESGGE